MLEYSKEEKIDCFNIDYFSSEENKIEIKISTNCFIPQTRSFYFKSKRDQRKLESFLKHLPEDRAMLQYKDKLSVFFLNREFESLVEGGRKCITHRDVENYLKNLNVFDPATTDTIGESCAQEERFDVLKKIMNEKSNVLYKIFSKYSETINNDEYMTEKNLSEFLEEHQNENLEKSEIPRDRSSS